VVATGRRKRCKTGGMKMNLCTAPLRGAFKEAAKSISRGFRVRNWEPAFEKVNRVVFNDSPISNF